MNTGKIPEGDCKHWYITRPERGSNAHCKHYFQELRDSVNHVRREMQSATAKLGQPVKCPDVGSGGGGGCVSTTVFVVLMFVQAALIISYLIYR